MKKTDVVIIGAGPAGTVCGYLLRQAGMSCVVVDHATFPREKICGGGLTPKAWKLLKKLMPSLPYQYNGVRHIKLMFDDVLKCEFDAKEEIRIVHRMQFDHELLKHYQAHGGEFIKGSFNQFEEQPDGQLLVTLRSGEQLLCRWLVGADGANSRVRRQLVGNYKGNILCTEQYTKKGPNEVTVSLSEDYDDGYFFRFPGTDFDVVGYGDYTNTPVRFRERLYDMDIAETKIRGSYISMETVESPKRNVILIGDAGGFVNKVTSEGLYYAFATARNASRAIAEGRPFRETNKVIFQKKRSEQTKARLFYSNLGLRMVKLATHSPRLVKFLFDINV